MSTLAKAARKKRQMRQNAAVRERPWIIAGTALVSLLFLVLMVVLIGCKKPSQAEIELEQRETARLRADRVARSILYGYEERTGRCFAYLYEQHNSGTLAHGGPALDTFECTEKVRALVVNPPAAWNEMATPQAGTPAEHPATP